MENSDFAKIFWDLAEFLELKNENRFKVAAYRKAAQNIESLSENLGTIYKAGGLKALEEIPGIGQGIATKIEKTIKSGKLDVYEKLRKEFPRGFLELVETPGMGPKTAMLLYKKLKIDSRAKLEKAAKEGKLQGLPGMGAKKEENILKGVELKKKISGRFLLNAALDQAEAVAKELEKLKEVEKILICGSLRRRKETIGDADILVIAKRSKNIMQRFTSLPQAQRILVKGETKSSIVLKMGMQVDLRVVEDKSFGSAAHYFTGCKAHNIKLREMAIKKGLKLSEYGFFKKDKWVAGRTEKEVFKTVGLTYIPPELREMRGEIEAAQKGKLPKLIESKDIKGDLHMHTIETDGSNTIEQMAQAAKKLGYEYIAITDHTQSTRIAHGMDEKRTLKHLKEIDRVNKKIQGIRVLKGAEVDILPDGRMDLPDSILKQMDLVIAAVHSNFKMPEDQMTRRILKALENKYVNILAHPTGRLIGEREAYKVDIEKVIAIAKKTKTALELNSHPQRLDLNDVNCRLAKDQGVLISINTDSHTTDQLNLMKYGIFTARRGWLEKKNILNALTLDKLLKILFAKR